MAVSRLQLFSQITQAGWALVTTGKFRPLNDGTNAFVQYVTPIDETGAVIGGSGSPTVVTTSGTAAAPTFYVQTATPATAITGQVKISVTGTAVQLASNVLVNGLFVTSKTTNAPYGTVGGAGVTNTVDGTGNGYILPAGASASFAVSNSNAIYVNGTAGDIFSFGGN